jgi:hypothetical protein
MKKTVQIVTIPLDKEGYDTNDLIKKPEFDAAGEIERWRLAHYNTNVGIWQAQQLLVLSDDEIQKGNYFLEKDITEQGFENASIQKCEGLIPRCWIKKVIASYPQIEGTLPISKETVQAWIDAGTPGEGSVGFITNTKNHTEKYSVYFPDPQGNLLLEFGEKDEDYYDEDIYDAVIDFRKKHPEKVSVVKPSIPTDEEIDRICVRGCHDFILEKGIMTPITPQQYYTAGYKKALKDLGHE